jgi:hypothetical protein
MPNSPGDAPAAAEALKPLERDQVSSALSKQDPGQRRVRPPIARRDSTAGSAGFLARHGHRGPNCTSLLCRTRSGRNWSQALHVSAITSPAGLGGKKGRRRPGKRFSRSSYRRHRDRAGPTDHRQRRSGRPDDAVSIRARCNSMPKPGSGSARREVGEAAPSAHYPAARNCIHAGCTRAGK